MDDTDEVANVGFRHQYIHSERTLKYVYERIRFR